MEQPPSDRYLLKRYAFDRSQAAFSRLVDRHFRLVYATCYRELNQHELAEEAAQAVFLELARSSRAIRSEAAVVSWLYTTARHKAAHLRRQEQRHMARVQRAAEEVTWLYNRTEDEAWASIEPGLNDALSALSAPDQQAILLRFFNQMSMREVGLVMGTNEEAARKRISRALEKLRTALVKREAAAVSAAALAALLTKRAVCAVPAHLPSSIAQSAGALSRLSSPAQSLLGTGPSRGVSALNPLLAKGLLIVATTKIVTVAVAAVLLLVLLFVGVHKLRSSGATLPSSAPAGALENAGAPPSGGTVPMRSIRMDQKGDAMTSRGIGMAIMRYAMANHRFPDANRWMDEVASYGAAPQTSLLYTYNRNLSGLSYTGTSLRDFRLPTSTVPSPGSTILLYEGTANTKNASDTGQSLPAVGPYDGGLNVAFVDCHVRLSRVNEISTSGPNDGKDPSFQP